MLFGFNPLTLNVVLDLYIETALRTFAAHECHSLGLDVVDSFSLSFDYLGTDVIALP